MQVEFPPRPRFADYSLFPKSMTGLIKTLRDRGFGFIAPDGGAKDVFFHATEYKSGAFEDLREGQKVTFDIAESDKGPKAVNVQLA